MPIASDHDREPAAATARWLAEQQPGADARLILADLAETPLPAVAATAVSTAMLGADLLEEGLRQLREALGQ